MTTNPTIDDITAAARRSTQTMVRPSRAFWVELASALGVGPGRLDQNATEADLRALVVEAAIYLGPTR